MYDFKSHLQPGRLRTKASVIRQLHVTVPSGVSFDDFMKPDYLMHVASQLNPEDEITVQSDDRMWKAQVSVLYTSKKEVKLLKEWYIEIGEKESEPEEEEAEFHVAWKGPVKRWCVMSGKDYVADGLQDKTLAAQALRIHLGEIRV